MKKQNLLKKIFIIFALAAAGTLFAQTVVLDKAVTLDENSSITISSENFTNLKNGDYLSFKFKNSKGQNHNLKINSGAIKYGVVKGASNKKGLITPEKKSGIISYVLTPVDANTLKKDGLTITGTGLKISKIYFESAPVPKEEPIKVEVPVLKFDAKPAPVFEEGTPFSEHGKLKVKGAYLYDKNDEKFQLYGMSTHGIAWFPTYVNKEAFKTLCDDWDTNCVRLAMYVRENMGYCAGGNQTYLKNLVCSGIDAATELGMYVIVDWHVLNFNPNAHLEDAMIFFSEISQRYANYGNVIYELANEPVGAKWDSALKPYAENLIPVIRKNAPDALILMGTNTWSQDLEGPLNDPLKFENVMYCFHFYADTHKDSFRDRVASCIENGLPVFITEFGTCNASGNGGFNPSQSKLWFDLMEKYNISHMNWSMANKAETASIIRPDCSKTSGWDESELTESGKLIRDHFKSLKK